MAGSNLLVSDAMSPVSLTYKMRSRKFWKRSEDWIRLSPPLVGAYHIIVQALLMGRVICKASWRIIPPSSERPSRISRKNLPCQFSYPTDRMERLYDINVHGSFFTAREAARHMIPLGGGSIILVASMSANVGAVRSHTAIPTPY